MEVVGHFGELFSKLRPFTNRDSNGWFKWLLNFLRGWVGIGIKKLYIKSELKTFHLITKNGIAWAMNEALTRCTGRAHSRR